LQTTSVSSLLCSGYARLFRRAAARHAARPTDGSTWAPRRPGDKAEPAAAIRGAVSRLPKAVRCLPRS